MAPAVATLTYVYADSTAVLGPLALTAEPGTYDLCAKHAASTSAPKGWEVIRLPHSDEATRFTADGDDLMALADAVRKIGLSGEEIPAQPNADEQPAAPSEPAQPRLRIVRD